MGILLHPFVAIPISVSFKWLDKVCNYIGNNVEEQKNEGKLLKLKKCFSVCTIMLYLALILITGYCLLFQWINFRETQIDDCPYNRARDNCEKLFISRNTFYSRTFNQCDCFEDKCIKTQSILGNIEKIIPESNDVLHYILFGSIFLLIIFHFIECCYSPSVISMSKFFIGPTLNRGAIESKDISKVNFQETNEGIEMRKINKHSLSECVNPNNDVEFDTKKSPEVEQSATITNTESSVIEKRHSVDKKKSFSITCLKEKNRIVDLICITFSIILFAGLYTSCFTLLYPVSFKWAKVCNITEFDTHPDPDIIKCERKLVTI